jgi:predicted glycosyltransferase
MSKRVMFYSHDTFGLGHIRRTQKIANAISGPDKSVLIACSSPMANSFLSRPGIEYLNLPGFAKQMSGEYLPRSLNIPLEEFVSLRANLLLAAVRNFRPHMIIADKEPLGVKGELLPSLRYIREEKLNTKIVCGFRDILDEKVKVAEEWKRKGVPQALEEYYDSLLVYGERENFDFVSEYELSKSLAEKVVYTGYVQPKENIEKEFFPLDFSVERPLVTFTLGGGGDGWNFIDVFLKMIEVDGDNFNYVLLTGPFANMPLVERARRLEAERGNLKVIEFTSNTQGLFERSALVISMGGYNSVCELLHMQKYPLILPRVQPREEQLIRAKVFRAKGLCDYLHPADLNPESLSRKIRQMVQIDRTKIPSLDMSGIENMRSFIEEALDQCLKSASSSKVIPA